MNSASASHVVIAAVFDVEEDAVQALDALREAGIHPEQVSVMMPDRVATGAEEDDAGAQMAGGAAGGATMGGIVGGLAGWLLGIGALAIPGIGPVLGAGVLGSILAGAAIGAAAGGLLGGLVSLGIPEEEARTYERHLQAGRVLVTVHPADVPTAEQLRDVLEANGAYDVRLYESDTPPPTLPRADATGGEIAAPAPLDAPATEPAGYTVANIVDEVDETSEERDLTRDAAPRSVEEGKAISPTSNHGAAPADRGVTGPPAPGLPGTSESSTSAVGGPAEDLSGRSRDLTAVAAAVTPTAPIGATTATPYRSGGEAARTADPRTVRALTPASGDRGLGGPGEGGSTRARNRGPRNTDTEFRSGGAGSRGEETHG
jgi:hypothetical protein